MLEDKSGRLLGCSSWRVLYVLMGKLAFIETRELLRHLKQWSDVVRFAFHQTCGSEMADSHPQKKTRY